MIIKKERGSALILTIIIMLVLVVIGGALAMFGMVEIRQAQREEDELQAYYLARSAADAAAEYIVANPAIIDEMFENESTSLESKKMTLDGETLDVSLQLKKDGNDLVLESAGRVGSSKKVIQLRLKGKNSLGIEHILTVGGAGSSAEPAVHVTGSIDLGDEGSLFTGCTEPDSIVFNIDGNFHIPGGVHVSAAAADPERVVNSNKEVEIRTTDGQGGTPLPYFPDKFPFDDSDSKGHFKSDSGETIKDGRYDIIEIVKGSPLKVELGGNVRKIQAEKLILNDGLDIIDDEKNGKLLLYVRELNGNGGSLNKVGHPDFRRPDLLTMYYEGKETETFGGSSLTIHGDVIVKNPEVRIEGVDNFYGAIFSASSKRIFIPWGTALSNSLFIYAPAATVEIEHGSYASYRGAIVASRLVSHGALHMPFQTDFMDKNYLNERFGYAVSGSEGEGQRSYKRELWSVRR